MKSIQIAIIGALVLLSAACKSTKETVNEKVEEATEKTMTSLPLGSQSLFWKVVSPESKKTSYLYGTIHIISAEDFYMGKNVKEKLLAADKVVMEMDLDNMDVAAISKATLLPENKTIADYLSKEDFDFIVSSMSDSIGISETKFLTSYGRVKPMIIQQLIVYRFLGENPASYETIFNMMAQDADIETEGLETFTEQLNFLNQLPIEEQFADLVTSVREWDETKSQFSRLIDAYKAQDLKALNQLIEVEMENPKMRQLLLDKRNQNWIPQLQEYFNEGNAFVAVGAGHLEGTSGVINLLRTAGFQVLPLAMGEDVE